MPRAKSSKDGTRTPKKTGRPSSFKPEYATQAFKLCLLGATDAELADFFGVAESTINNWKNDHPSFLESLKRGKLQADAEVTHRLYRRATGYSHRAVKIFANAGETFEHPYIERYAPDTTAAIFWLKNRRPQDWRDKREEEEGNADERAARIAAAMDQIKARTLGVPANGNGTHR